MNFTIVVRMEGLDKLSLNERFLRLEFEDSFLLICIDNLRYKFKGLEKKQRIYC